MGFFNVPGPGHSFRVGDETAPRSPATPDTEPPYTDVKIVAASAIVLAIAFTGFRLYEDAKDLRDLRNLRKR
jgi:hypothetical protein